MYGLSPSFPSFSFFIISTSRGARPAESIFPTPRFTVIQTLNMAHDWQDHEQESSNGLLDMRSRKRRRRVADISDDQDVLPRRRAILACDVCRARRTKCDGQRPTCSFCQVCSGRSITRRLFHSTEFQNSPSTQNASTARLRNPLQRSKWCSSPAAQTYPAIRLESEIVIIKERLGNIEHLLSAQPRQPDATREIHTHLSPDAARTSSPRVPASVAADFQSPSVPQPPAFPTMVIRNKLFMRLVGLDCDLAVHLARFERSGDRKHHHEVGRHFFLQQHRALE